LSLRHAVAAAAAAAATYARLLAVLSGGRGSRLLLCLSLLVGLLLIGRSAHFSEYILGAGVVGTATEREETKGKKPLLSS
jgi:hypothetical protein